MRTPTTESTLYVTYIAAAPERVWEALTSAAFTERYFFGRRAESSWQPGADWCLRMPDGRIDVAGKVREADPPRRLSLSWRVEAMPDVPECIVTYTIEPVGTEMVRLTMEEAHPTAIPAELLQGGRRGWPMILSGLKTLLETGRPLPLPIPGPPAPPEPANA
ncbi:MAG: SRPBCC family protein [Gemmatimonadetes bacterium]|nr:SRPBCC family protein [Gemmatimonadota bacterium]